MSLLSWLFGYPGDAARRKVERAHAAGRAYAVRTLATTAQDKVVDQCTALRTAADGVYNEEPWEYAFDRGVIEVCTEALRELGEP